MATITPVTFPSVASDPVRDSGPLRETYRKPAGATRPENTKPVQEQPPPAQSSGPQEMAHGPAEKTPTLAGVRFYHPQAAKVRNVPQLGKHIDIRV
jgi:hypothetical protein